MKSLIILTILSISLMGCGHSAARHQPIVDGPKDSRYFSDLENCQALAEQRSYVNDDVKSNALMGSVVGGIAGVLEDGAGGLAVGAVAGGLVGGGAKTWETRGERKRIVCECMRQRGHRVVEN